MTNEKFTQGEWKVERVDIDEGGCPHFTVMCILGDNGGIRIDGEIIQSTAALIAAAPQMYALLKLMTEQTFMGATIPQYLRSAIEAVLKKARGEE